MCNGSLIISIANFNALEFLALSIWPSGQKGNQHRHDDVVSASPERFLSLSYTVKEYS